MNANTCEDGTFTYEFCYSTSFEDHQIKLRTNYVESAKKAKNCADWNNADGCEKEAHAYLFNQHNGVFVKAFKQFSILGDNKVIGGDRMRTVCKTYTNNQVTCGETGIPVYGAHMNLIGSVSQAYPGAVPTSEYKACFSTTRETGNWFGQDRPDCAQGAGQVGAGGVSKGVSPSKGVPPSKGVTRRTQIGANGRLPPERPQPQQAGNPLNKLPKLAPPLPNGPQGAAGAVDKTDKTDKTTTKANCEGPKRKVRKLRQRR